MVKKAFFILICLSGIAYSQNQVKPESLGFIIKRGQIDESRMSASQKDTIAISLFNSEDYFLDIAVYSKSKQAILIYKNLGNGSLTLYRQFPVEKNVRKIEAVKPLNYPRFLPVFYDLKITYADGTIFLLNNRRINSSSNSLENIKVPLRDFLDDPRAFVYDISFNEVWRSDRNGQPSNSVSIGDLDNDGKNEAVYTFWPINDTFPQGYPTHMVIFESYGDNQYRIDWDTVFTDGGYNMLPYVTDFDKNGQKEFFAVSYSQWNHEFTPGFFECKGEGKYRFYSNSALYFYSSIFDAIILDTVKYGNNRKAGFWVLDSYYQEPYYITSIEQFSFVAKGEALGVFSFQSYPPQPISNPALTYAFAIGDIDNDGKEEIIVGDNQWGTNFVNYLDSTGASTNSGYELKTIIPNAPLSVGFSKLKDYDNDGKLEITTCGIGDHSGSIGIIKHAGAPGENNFNTVWWDTIDIHAGPNLGIDTNYIDNDFSILYPYVYSSGPHYWSYILTYKRKSTYMFVRSSYEFIDSAAFLGAILKDMDKDDKMDIIGSFSYMGYGNTYLVDFEEINTIGINPNSNSLPEQFRLFQNYPNPFNSETIIEYELSKKCFVRIKIFDVLGREVEVLEDSRRLPGKYNIRFSGNKLSSGVYFYSLIIDGLLVNTKKMILLK